MTQLLPSIVIGHSRTGNNRGDTKVLNAPVNAFGRAKEALDSLGGDWADRARAWLVGTVATTFPADRSAELNLVPVDRVVAGILASLTTPEAIGARVHLATDNRIRSEEVCRITEEELEVSVRMADPTLTRNLTLPLVKALLLALGEPKLANVLERLGTIFGVYGEWGQPIHDVGNDVRLLGLPIRRPGHPGLLPDALPAQQVRAGVRAGAGPRRGGPARAAVGERDRRDRVRDGPPGGVDAAAGVPAAARRRGSTRARSRSAEARCRRRRRGRMLRRGRAPTRGPERKEPNHDGRSRSPGPAPVPGRGGPHPGRPPS